MSNAPAPTWLDKFFQIQLQDQDGNDYQQQPVLQVTGSGVTVTPDPTNNRNILQFNAGSSAGQGTTSVVNGLNSDVATNGNPTLRLIGPTAAFSLGGFAPAGGGNWQKGQELEIINTTAEALTILHEDTSSAAANRISVGLSSSSPAAGALLPALGRARFIYDGTSSRFVLQSIASPYSLVVSVKKFGAVGDGVTDDTAAINRAVSYLATIAGIVATGGPCLLFEMGGYVTTTGITLPAFCHVRGSGKGTSIIRTTPGNVITTPGSPQMFLEISDLDILGYNYPSTSLPTWSAGITPTVGAYYQLTVPSYVLLQATTVTGATGAHRPLGKLTWLQQPEGSGVPPVSNWPDIVITGTPSSDIDLVIQIIAGGAPGSATFQYSTNAGSSWSSTTSTGSAVAIGATGLTADFTATGKGTYDAGSFAESPVGGFSLAIGTQIVDGGVTWTLVAGGAGISDTGGSVLNVERVNIYGTWVGVVLDGTEQAAFTDVQMANAVGQGFCGIWICGAYCGSPHSSLLGDSTNVVQFRDFFITGYRIPIVDDGGQGHYFDDFNTEGGSYSGAHILGTNIRFTNGDFSDDFLPMTFGGGQYHLPTLPAANSGGIAHGSGDFDQITFLNVGFGPPAGHPIANIVSSDTTSLRILRVGDCLLGNGSSAAFVGCANLGSFIDQGGNDCYNGASATLCDTFVSKYGGVFGPGFSAAKQYGGLGVNTLPAGGIACNGPVRATVAYITNALSPYTVDTTAGVAGDHDLHVDSTLGAVTINLPPASSHYDGVTGRELWLLDYASTSGTNHITFTPSSGTIGGAASLVFNTNGQKARIVASRGNNWVVYPL